jgi:predicted transcriptional regulator
MRRSKLETCLSILETLASYGPLRITHVMQKANLNCKVMKNYFDFLIKEGAVEVKCVGRDRIVYANTERGLYLIRCFKELNQVIPTGKIRIGIPSIRAKNEPNWHVEKRIVNLGPNDSHVENWQ